MTIVKLVPSTHSVSSNYLSVTNADNMYTNISSATYATVSNTNASTTSYYLYINGFNFSVIPADALVKSFTVRLRAYQTGGSTSTSYRPRLVNDTTTITGSSGVIGTSDTTIEFTGVTASWDTIKGYGSNFGVRINCRRNSSGTASTFYIYGAEIEVEYVQPVSVTVSNSTSATVVVSDSAPYEGEDVVVTTDTLHDISISDNGVDITNLFVDAYASVPFVIDDYSVSGTMAGGGGDYTAAVGRGSDTSAQSSGYVYGTTGSVYVAYSFDFSSIPADAVVQSITCTVKGASAEGGGATVQLYKGSAAMGSASNLASSTHTVVTLTAGSWTRSDLDDLTLRFSPGSYMAGGIVDGATVTVTYASGYQYTISDISDDHVIVVSDAERIFMKTGGSWVQMSKAYQKVSGTWTEISGGDLLTYTSDKVVILG